MVPVKSAFPFPSFAAQPVSAMVRVAATAATLMNELFILTFLIFGTIEIYVSKVNTGDYKGKRQVNSLLHVE
jgi:hypothetical protein